MSEKNYGFSDESSNLERYLRDASCFTLLGLDEEKEISAMSFAGCEVSQTKMINSNLFLVVSMARGYAGYNLPILDLINEGNIGLMTAVKKYNPARLPYAKFSTYAVWWIRQSIIRAIKNKSRVVRVPVGRIEKISKIGRANRTLSNELGRDPSISEISERTGLGIVSVNRTLGCANTWIVPIDSPISDNSSTTYAERLSSDVERVDVGITRAEDLAQLSKALTVLTPKELVIIKRRFGFNEVPVETLDQIGLSLGLTRERIRQIQLGATKKLRREIEVHERDGL